MPRAAPRGNRNARLPPPEVAGKVRYCTSAVGAGGGRADASNETLPCRYAMENLPVWEPVDVLAPRCRAHFGSLPPCQGDMSRKRRN
jgi:hypothetical protein